MHDRSIIQERDKFEVVLKLLDHFWLNTSAQLLYLVKQMVYGKLIPGSLAYHAVNNEFKQSQDKSRKTRPYGSQV